MYTGKIQCGDMCHVQILVSRDTGVIGHFQVSLNELHYESKALCITYCEN